MQIEKIIKFKNDFEYLFKQESFSIANSGINPEGFEINITPPSTIEGQHNKINNISISVEISEKFCQINEICFYFEEGKKNPIVKSLNKKINHLEDIVELIKSLKKSCLKYS